MKNYLILFILSMIAWHSKAQDTGQMRYLYGTEEIPGAKVKVESLEELDKPKLYVHKAEQDQKRFGVFGDTGWWICRCSDKP
ncbi:hypothetical protein [Sphingobacterium daejeonense]|uniref:hypothetical protein n=1 Tax=Sphingobacterium daejeonense TaxID=371142 RepID=UPI0010C2908F|nr:hypothetical protein [Sphingobacterium daejeonense]VTQ06325.1 Uncharacterised protein [Sphingobacterium daejeonense]